MSTESYVPAALSSNVPQEPKLLNGAQAMGLGYCLAGARISYTFPITPQSEVIDYLAAHPDITCIQADSEYNVLSGAQGVLWGGERCAVATSSQGLILMSEVMWEVAGNRLPMVLGVFSRGLKGPGWCLGTQQTDALFMRDTGWLQLYCESAQEILDFILIGHRLAETTSLPVMIVGDGFYLSHVQENVVTPDAAVAAGFVGPPAWPNMPLESAPASYGALVPPERYSRFYWTMHEDVQRSASVFAGIAADFSITFGRIYSLAVEEMTADADLVVVTAGALAGTARQVVRQRRERGERVGLLKLHGFRPFPAEDAARVLGRVSRALVLDRNLAPGIGGIFAAHLRGALQERGLNTPVFGAVTGLGGLDVTPAMIDRAIEYALNNPPTPGPLFLDDDGIFSGG